MFQIGNTEIFAMPDGNLTAKTVSHFNQEVVNGLAQAAGIWDIFVIDMNNVAKIDTFGIQTIIYFYKHTKELEKQFMLINVHQDLLRFMQLFRLHTKFPIGLNKTSAQLEAERQKGSKP
jgi:anti-anti-sigma factor